MGIRTRSATSSPVKAAAKKPDSELSQSHPLKFFILPKDTSADSRFLLLQHPRDETKTRFFFCPQKGLYEFTKIAAPSVDPRSILFTPESFAADETRPVSSAGIGEGYVNKAAEFFISTPFDLSFVLLPILMPKKTNEKSLFQPLDDILEYQLEEDRHLRYILKNGRNLVNEAMRRICDEVDAGDEKMYRLSDDKLLRNIIGKAEKAVKRGLPPSLEEKFVTRALEAPVLGIKREKSSTTVVRTAEDLEAHDESDGFGSQKEADSFDTQSSTASTAPSTIFSEATVTSTTTVESVVEDKAATDLRYLQRIQTAISFIISSYTSTHISSRITTLIDSEKSPLSLTPLNEHLKQLGMLRAEAQASRSIGDFSRKRGIDMEDEEMLETKAEKKRKLDDEEKRKKAGESHGVRALKKVNVTGMKKMSDFFGKKPAAAKAKT